MPTMCAMQPLEHYDISPITGFLPEEPPLQRLQDPYFEPWENMMNDFNGLLLAGKLRQKIKMVSYNLRCFNVWTEKLINIFRCHCLTTLACKLCRSIAGLSLFFVCFLTAMFGANMKKHQRCVWRDITGTSIFNINFPTTGFACQSCSTVDWNSQPPGTMSCGVPRRCSFVELQTVGSRRSYRS